ncbi:hypothetical protein HWV62_39075 [Athelia sp. TMB]|nr:hypothetical protein HWV62_9335 [Athelia sp. TMB]KAF7980296.1 hypothetical protein HWV62_39075 [Athelia sp. TMB]
MFSPLSFKKFQRRLRSPFTIFKKIGKKSRKQGTTKHKRGPSQVIEPAAISEKQVSPETLDVPTLVIPSTPSTAASSDCGGTFPVTPQSATSDFTPAVHVYKEESRLPELPNLSAFEQAVVPQDLYRGSARKEAAPLAELPAEANNLCSEEPASQVQVQTEDKSISPVLSLVQPVKDSAETTLTLKDDDIASIPSEHEDAVEIIDIPKVAPVQIQEVTSVASESLPGPQAIELVHSPVKLDISVVDTNVQEHHAASEAEQFAEEPVMIAAPMRTEPEHIEDKVPELLLEEAKVSTAAAVPTTPVTSTIPLPAAPEPQTPVKALAKPSLNHSQSQPASPAFPKSILKSPSTPRMRVTSEGQTAADKNIMAELQASVKKRDDKRLAQERLKAAEKERELRIRMEAKAKEGVVDEKDAGEVLQEVRAWRKQREASLKKAPEDTAKTAAYREAFAREEIMEELLKNVQDRSTRTPFTEDPAEKRQQLVLEELFANRGPVLMKA